MPPIHYGSNSEAKCGAADGLVSQRAAEVTCRTCRDVGGVCQLCKGRGHNQWNTVCICQVTDDKDDRYWHPTDIPEEVQRQLMSAAVGNGRISYHWLCDVYRRGRGDGAGKQDDLLSALREVRHHLTAPFIDTDGVVQQYAKAILVIHDAIAKAEGS
jgi:hypothetical protein